MVTVKTPKRKQQITTDEAKLSYKEWRKTHLPQYEKIEILLQDAEDFSRKLKNLERDRMAILSTLKTTADWQ